MIEVVFSNSAAGVLRCAQLCGPGGMEAVGDVYAVREEAPTAEAPEQAEREFRTRRGSGRPIGGRSEDIFPLANDLSTGDISGDCLQEARRESLTRLLALFPEEREYALKDLEQARMNLERLLARAGTGEPIRIWYSSQAWEYCGMCYLVAELQARLPSLPEIHLVKLPHEVQQAAKIVAYMGWGDVEPEEVCDLLRLEEVADLPRLRQAQGTWLRLQEDNAPLRVEINGIMQSVPEDFYDPFIRREVERAPREFLQAEVIGEVMGRYQLGIGDTWIAARMEKLLQSGELEAVTEPKPGDCIYRRILRKG